MPHGTQAGAQLLDRGAGNVDRAYFGCLGDPSSVKVASPCHDEAVFAGQLDQELLLRLSAMVEDIPQIAELDFNPVKVMARGEGYCVVDARISVK